MGNIILLLINRTCRSRIKYFFIATITFFLFSSFISYYNYPIKNHFEKEKLTNENPTTILPPWWIEPNIKCINYIKVKPSTKLQLPKSQIAITDSYAKREAKFKARDVYRNEKEEESCQNYLQRRHFILKSQSQEELDFPLAYSVLVFTHYSQVELLLRAIYRPEHAICIHIDIKAEEKFKKALKNLADCFPQDSLFLAPNPVNVTWGKTSVLDAELVCMQHLWNLIKKKKWKYFINLTGQEFPLRTNLELVRILKIFKGANSMEGTIERVISRVIPKENVSFPLLWVKGSAHIVASAAFVNFSLNSYVAKCIYQVLSRYRIGSPVEKFFATLNHNPHLDVPGSYLLMPETHPVKYPFIARLKNWDEYPFYYPCESQKYVRQICIWGLLDLPFITSRTELFVNKFHWDFENLAIKCLQEWYWNRTMRDIQTGNVDINLTYYENLSFVKHHK